MKHPRITLALTIAALAGLAAGCVTRTTVKDAARQDIQFATPQAAKVFYDTYLAKTDPKKNSATLYVPLPYQHNTVETDNVRFNAAAHAADTNHDGIITEEEAQTFAAQSRATQLARSNSQ
ncbi:MAG: hypothetical protein U1F65_08905 [Verrucomicrobiota bacterium]